MGEDHNPELIKKSVVGKDYKKYDGIEKGYGDAN